MSKSSIQARNLARIRVLNGHDVDAVEVKIRGRNGQVQPAGPISIRVGGVSFQVITDVPVTGAKDPANRCLNPAPGFQQAWQDTFGDRESVKCESVRRNKPSNHDREGQPDFEVVTYLYAILQPLANVPR